MKKNFPLLAWVFILPAALNGEARAAPPAGQGTGRPVEGPKAVQVRIFTPRVFVKGLDDDAKVKEVERALRRLPSAKLVPHSSATPHLLVEYDPGRTDLGEMAKALAAVKNPEADALPPAFLLVPVHLSRGQQDRVKRALAEVKGVSAKQSQVTSGRLLLALEAQGGAKLSEVMAAIASALRDRAGQESPREAAADRDRRKLQGTWKTLSVEENGKPVEQERGSTWAFQGDKLVRPKGLQPEGTFTLDAGTSPKAIDVVTRWGVVPGIYAFEGDALRLCFTSGFGRPAGFTPKENKRVAYRLYVLKRAKPAGKPAAEANVAPARVVAGLKERGVQVEVEEGDPGRPVKVDFTGARVSDADLESLQGLTSLQSLSTGSISRRGERTPVTDAGMRHLQGLTQLRELYVYGTEITDQGLEHLRGLTNLEVLSLANTQATDRGLEHLRGLTKLRELDLHNAKVTDQGLQYLGQLTGLRKLDLRATRVTDRGLVHLRGFTQLRTLSLDFTDITDAGLVTLRGLTSLRNLEVHDTRVTDKGVTELQNALPKLKVAR